MDYYTYYEWIKVSFAFAQTVWILPPDPIGTDEKPTNNIWTSEVTPRIEQSIQLTGKMSTMGTQSVFRRDLQKRLPEDINSCQ